MNIRLAAVLVCITILTLQSCVDHNLPEPQVDECGGTVSFQNDVKPIINSSCAIPGCHNGDNGADRNWTVFTNFQNKRASVRDRISRPPGTPGHMPATGSITPDQLQTIVCWVDQGGLNN